MTTNRAPNKIEQQLGLDFRDKNKQVWLTQQRTLRKLVGILGVLLPFLLYLFLLFGYDHHTVLPSVSHYFYTRASICFIIIVSLLAIFLLVYKGEEPVDFYLSSAAGVFALCVLLFPTDNLSANCTNNPYSYIITFLSDSPARKTFHFISAAVFLGCLDAMSFFLFTKSNCPPEKRRPEKKWRNRVYRTCSLFMTLALLVAFLGYLGIINESYYESNNLTFWMEAIAIEAFGISWLTKAELIFGDKKK
jgi:F0F1-type ATP synthase assembly protein I